MNTPSTSSRHGAPSVIEAAQLHGLMDHLLLNWASCTSYWGLHARQQLLPKLHKEIGSRALQGGMSHRAPTHNTYGLRAHMVCREAGSRCVHPCPSAPFPPTLHRAQPVDQGSVATGNGRFYIRSHAEGFEASAGASVVAGCGHKHQACHSAWHAWDLECRMQ